MTLTVPPRSEIAAEHTWNAPSMFASTEAWQAEYQKIVEEIPSLEPYKGKISENPKTLLEFIEHSENLVSRLRKVLVYAGMETNVDSGNQTAAGMFGQAQGLIGRFRAAAAFYEPELLQLGLDKLRQWMKDEPKLAIYGQYIEDLFRQQAHVRSAEIEEILGMVSEPFASVRGTMSVLVNNEIEFGNATPSVSDPIRVEQSNIQALLMESDRQTRKTAWENYADGYLAFKNTLANNYLTSVKQNVFNARARRYGSALEAALFPDNIPTEVFYSLIETYRKNLPTWHRYWRIRREALGLDTIHTYDIWSPITPKEPEVSYVQAVDYISAGMKPLGEEYVRILRQGCLQDRWVDIYPNQGKRQGAFSWGTKGTHPFIMMSYTNDLKSMSTLAHELGHSMHSYFTYQTQPQQYADYSLFAAEVASNFNQAMVRAHLLETQSDRNFQIAVIEEGMTNFHRYFFIMPTLARFELEVHERVEKGKGVTADDLNNLMADLYSEGYGSEMTLDRDRDGITWAQFSHLYTSFYTFQYATGISGAHALAHDILNGKSPDNYLKFLNAGSSLYALDALKMAGVDLASPEPVEKTFELFTGLVDRLETLVKQS